MGTFMYDAERIREIDDRLLAHLQVVISAKLRRHESFFFTWQRAVAFGSGRDVFWIHPYAALKFEFNGNRPPTINRAWIDALAETSNSPSGLRVVKEPEGLVDIPGDAQGSSTTRPSPR